MVKLISHVFGNVMLLVGQSVERLYEGEVKLLLCSSLVRFPALPCMTLTYICFHGQWIETSMQVYHFSKQCVFSLFACFAFYFYFLVPQIDLSHLCLFKYLAPLSSAFLYSDFSIKSKQQKLCILKNYSYLKQYKYLELYIS